MVLGGFIESIVSVSSEQSEWPQSMDYNEFSTSSLNNITYVLKKWIY